MVNSIKYNCVFGGGGIRGLCYIGAVKALQENNIELESIAGSSVGAVFASLLAVGYNADEIKEMFFEFNFNMFRDININIFNNDISLSKGEIFLEWLRNKYSEKLYGIKNQKVYFKDIDKDLRILTIDINTNTPHIFSKETTPDTEIAYAVRTSASLPGLMKPINEGKAILVDGDLIKSWPAWKIYNELNTKETRLLEFRLEGSRDDSDIKNPIDYVNSIINTIWYLSTENVFNEYHNNDRYDYVVIDAKDIILFDFTLDKNTKEKLIEKGYTTTKTYFEKTLINKKEKILEIYQNIKRNMTILTKSITQKKVLETMLVINEILSSMYEDTKYIDISIYEDIKALKIYIKNSIKKQFIFSKKIENEQQILKKCELVTLSLDEKINDLKNYINFYCNNCKE